VSVTGGSCSGAWIARELQASLQLGAADAQLATEPDHAYGSCDTIWTFEEVVQRRDKGGEFAFDNAPDQLIVDACISMNEDIAESYNARQLRNPGCGRWIYSAQLRKGFPYDFELSLDCGTKKLISLVRFKCTSTR
jgi:hypothetical protein